MVGKEQREIDLLIAENDKLHPVEIKKHAAPRRDDTRSFTALKDDIRGSGAVVSMYENAVPLGERDGNVPVWAL